MTRVVQSVLYTDIASTFGTTYVEVYLEPDPLSRGWRVRCPRCGGSVIGEIAAPYRAAYPSLQRVHSSGLVPSTVAGVRLDAARGLFNVDVFLPPEPVAVPRNNVPAGAAVLPPGDMVVVDTSAGEFSAPELEFRSPGQWLVGLVTVGDAVVVTLDGTVLGTADINLAGDGVAYARAHIVEAMVGLDIGEPEPNPPAVPALTAPPPEREGAWEAMDFPDGGWAVTVGRDNAIDAGDLPDPAAGARRVRSPSAPAPSVDFTPTTSFSASAATYLTEVEKARLRREQSGRARGRHRK